MRGFDLDEEDRRLRYWRRYAQRAVLIATRDGLPEIGSDEIRVHRPIENDPYVSTKNVMVSFRTACGKPVAILEKLWVDGEHTHTIDRTGVVVDPITGDIHDAGLFHQISPGDYTSILSMTEIQIDRLRKDRRREGHKKDEKMSAHVIEKMKAREADLRSLADTFKKAADVMGITADPHTLASKRKLFRIHPSSQIA